MQSVNIFNPNLPPMNFRPEIYDMDRDIELINILANILNSKQLLYIGNSSYIPKSIASENKNCLTITVPKELIKESSDNTLLSNNFTTISPDSIIIVEKGNRIELYLDVQCIITHDVLENQTKYTGYKFLSNLLESKFIYINNNVLDIFKNNFSYYLDLNKNEFFFDNLIHLTMIVKNAGDQFKQVLEHNLQFVDEWTILDTGSTDNTIQIIKDVMKNKKGTLYQEPFINFRDSRNRCLDLAGTSCVFNIMLDDTYLLNGKDLRKFLSMARTDDYADSFSQFIKTDVQYVSNRITKSHKKLRYLYKIHEVIETNKSLLIPIEYSYITESVDENKYMKNRTESRKDFDLKLLFEENKENPNDPRHYYYIAETYLCKQDWIEAFFWYKKRAEFKDGLIEEKQDSLYKMAYFADTYLNKNWDDVQKMYLDCFEFQPRPEAMFMLAEHYLKPDFYQPAQAFIYLKKAFLCLDDAKKLQMNAKINMYNNYVTNRLIPLCFNQNEPQLGIDACIHAIKNSTISEFVSVAQNWINIFDKKINSQKYFYEKITYPSANGKKLVCFLMDGGWEKWNSKTLVSKGLGGSETFIVKYAKQLFELGYHVIVFCNCYPDNSDGVEYRELSSYYKFCAKYNIDYCLINRFPEYLCVNYNNNVPTYLILHDLFRDNEIIIDSQYLKGILCISEWHSEYVKRVFPQYVNKIKTISYGIDNKLFKFKPNSHKKKLSFIYSSFPNRGLIHLLRLFPKILQKYPEATLNIFCDTKHKFCQQYYKNDMDEIDLLLEKLSPNVINHGWVSGDVLREYYVQSEVWLYPCVFQETCCLTAYESACSKTLVITNHLAALRDSVGDRGIIFEQKVGSEEWELEIMNILDDIYLNKKIDVDNLINKNYEWVCNKNYENVVTDFATKYLNYKQI